MVNFLAEDQSLATHKTLSSSETHQNLIELNLFICDSSSRHDNVWLSVSLLVCLFVGQRGMNYNKLKFTEQNT